MNDLVITRPRSPTWSRTTAWSASCTSGVSEVRLTPMVVAPSARLAASAATVSVVVPVRDNPTTTVSRRSHTSGFIHRSDAGTERAVCALRALNSPAAAVPAW